MPSLFAFDLSPTTLLILGVIAVLLYGERLPEVARSIGKGLMEFKRGVRSIRDEVEGAINSAASTTAASQHYEKPEEREEATAPKFEPPTS
jgi:sec-independent protein translocase protein TatA